MCQKQKIIAISALNYFLMVARGSTIKHKSAEIEIETEGKGRGREGESGGGRATNGQFVKTSLSWCDRWELTELLFRGLEKKEKRKGKVR